MILKCGVGRYARLGKNAVQVKLGQHEEIASLQDRGIISGICYGDTEILKHRSGGNESFEGSGQIRRGEVESQRVQPKEHRVRKDFLLAWVPDVHQERVRL